jgi:hypothetical protein
MRREGLKLTLAYQPARITNVYRPKRFQGVRTSRMTTVAANTTYVYWSCTGIVHKTPMQ